MRTNIRISGAQLPTALHDLSLNQFDVFPAVNESQFILCDAACFEPQNALQQAGRVQPVYDRIVSFRPLGVTGSGIMLLYRWIGSKASPNLSLRSAAVPIHGAVTLLPGSSFD